MITANIIDQVDEITFQSLYTDSEKYLLEGNLDPRLDFNSESLRTRVNTTGSMPNKTIVLVTEDSGHPLALLAGMLTDTTFNVHFCLFGRQSDTGSYTKLYNISVAEKQALFHPLGIHHMRYHVYGRNLKLALITKGCTIESESDRESIMIPEGF